MHRLFGFGQSLRTTASFKTRAGGCLVDVASALAAKLVAVSNKTSSPITRVIVTSLRFPGPSSASAGFFFNSQASLRARLNQSEISNLNEVQTFSTSRSSSICLAIRAAVAQCCSTPAASPRRWQLAIRLSTQASEFCTTMMRSALIGANYWLATRGYRFAGEAE